MSVDIVLENCMGKAQLLSYLRAILKISTYGNSLYGIQFTIEICTLVSLSLVASMYLLFCCGLEVLWVLSSDHIEAKIL